MSRTIAIYHVPAGYPLSGILKLKRKIGDGDWTDIENPTIPNQISTEWYLNFVDDNNKALFSYKINWTGITHNQPWVEITLSGKDTLALKGKMLHLEISNTDGVSDLITPPEEYFNFVANMIPPMTKTVQTTT